MKIYGNKKLTNLKNQLSTHRWNNKNILFCCFIPYSQFYVWGQILWNSTAFANTLTITLMISSNVFLILQWKQVILWGLQKFWLLIIIPVYPLYSNSHPLANQSISAVIINAFLSSSLIKIIFQLAKYL